MHKKLEGYEVIQVYYAWPVFEYPAACHMVSDCQLFNVNPFVTDTSNSTHACMWGATFKCVIPTISYLILVM